MTCSPSTSARTWREGGQRLPFSLRVRLTAANPVGRRPRSTPQLRLHEDQPGEHGSAVARDRSLPPVRCCRAAVPKPHHSEVRWRLSPQYEHHRPPPHEQGSEQAGSRFWTGGTCSAQLARHDLACSRETYVGASSFQSTSDVRIAFATVHPSPGSRCRWHGAPWSRSPRGRARQPKRSPTGCRCR